MKTWTRITKTTTFTKVATLSEGVPTYLVKLSSGKEETLLSEQV